MQKEFVVRVWIDPKTDGYVDDRLPAPVPVWLNDNVGGRGLDWHYWEDAAGNYFEFKNDADATLFMLRWQGQLPQ